MLGIAPGGLTPDGIPASGLSALSRSLDQRLLEGSVLALLVAVDGEVPYERVVAAIDAASGAGVERTALRSSRSPD